MKSRWDIRFVTASAALTLAACTMPAENVAPPEMKKSAAEKPTPEVSTIPLEEFYQLHESGKAVVIDARPSFVYQFGHVPGAINFPKSRCDDAIMKRNAELHNAVAKGKKIIVYCTGPNCPDARTVANHLAAAGIPSSVFPSGWEGWHEAGLPVE